VIFHDVYADVPAAELERFVRAQELGRLVTVAADGAPHIGLYPFTYDGAATSRSPICGRTGAASSRWTRCWR